MSGVTLTQLGVQPPVDLLSFALAYFHWWYFIRPVNIEDA